MTGHLIATARWRALDREGEDTCRLFRTDTGWMLMGHARFRDVLGMASLNYVVRCSDAWETQSADVAGRHEGSEVQAKMYQDQGRWWVGDKLQLEVEGAIDIDLSFTPATNLMPLRRLTAHTDDAIDVCAAWLLYPCATLRPLDQTYRRAGHAGAVCYAAAQTGFEADLTCDPSGFVTHYPDLWEGEVTRES